MSDIRYIRDPEYMRRKESRTVRDDNREILPLCVIEVGKLTVASKVYIDTVSLLISRRYVEIPQSGWHI